MGDGEDTPDAVRVERIEVEPNNCALEESLNMSIDFVVLSSLMDSHWEVRVRGKTIPTEDLRY